MHFVEYKDFHFNLGFMGISYDDAKRFFKNFDDIIAAADISDFFRKVLIDLHKRRVLSFVRNSVNCWSIDLEWPAMEAGHQDREKKIEESKLFTSLESENLGLKGHYLFRYKKSIVFL